MKRFKALLKEVDVNGDGRINMHELSELLQRLGLSNPRWKAFFLMRQVDNNGNHTIEGRFEMKILIKHLRELWGIVIS
ncbi:hypothetical protein QJS04_geneDACA021738 [Acorus gramineus]|uniref:EF-hand domain-containing protein n=1 Tax=Acorus gramineus TaxID=55184 RepID=A0AAV9AHE0_ACOGR|nr:hypothetical protein QJS04_geneDACA021738 [Acorus gramineus]